ncbi:hypothetical protein D3C81_1538050 [compost metagenome]
MHGTTRSVIDDASAGAEIKQLPKRRDLTAAATQERMGDSQTNPDPDFATFLHRTLFM